MYVNISRYRGYTRVRLLRKVVTGGISKISLVEHIGSARSEPELATLQALAEQRLAELRSQLSLLTSLDNQANLQANDTSRLTISGSFASGLWRVIGGLYDQVGLPNDLLKYLVLARIATPKSKRATARYLKDNLRLPIGLQTIYDYMDSLDKDQLMTTILSYARKRALATTGQTISVVFYDVTTLYFETDEDDPDSNVLETAETVDTGSVASTSAVSTTARTTTTPGLRKKGYSKDHRFDLPQVVVGLTVDNTGFPLDIQIYEGNTYEGHTLLAGVRSMQVKLQLAASKLTVVADAGMLSKANLEELEALGYRYIVGARIRSSKAEVAEQITTWDYAKQGALDTTIDGRRMVVTFVRKRAERSQQNRQRLVAKLQAKLDRGQVVKKSKYVILTDASAAGKNPGRPKLAGVIDQAKLEADARFDGLKGYVTNIPQTELSAAVVIEHYGNLWKVEKSFRMTKSDLRARPTFHYKRERVIAHLVICVCALAVLREFEAMLQALPMPIAVPIPRLQPKPMAKPRPAMAKLQDGTKTTITAKIDTNTQLPNKPKPDPRPGLSIALEQLLAIREYQLTLPNQQQVSVLSELTEVQAWLLRGQKSPGE